MTTQLPQRERSEADPQRDWQLPEVLFEEARRRRRRRWMVGGVLAAALAAGALLLGIGGGGGGGGGLPARGHGQPSGAGSGSGAGHLSASRPFPDAPASELYYTGPGASCPLAPRSRYLPPWSGCVSTAVADVSGSGRRDLVLVYSRLSHRGLRGLPPRTTGRRGAAERFPALQAMLRVVTPGGRVTTVPLAYWGTPFNNGPARLQRVAAAALISVAHVSDEPGATVFLQTGEISSGSLALAYTLDGSRLVSSGAVLGYGGDSGSQGGFECVAGNPPQLIAHTYELIRGIKTIGGGVHIYGWWKVQTATFAWRGPRLVNVGHSTARRRLLPRDGAGPGCLKGVA